MINDFPLSLLRPAVRSLQPYITGCPSEAELASRADWVWLYANENPWPPVGNFAVACNVNRYPEPQPPSIRKLLARLYGVQPEQILLSRGSDEIPDLLIRSFCQPGRDGIVVCPPTFAMYEIGAQINESPVRRVPMRADRGYDLDVDAILRNWQPHEKLLFIPSPCIPLGHSMAKEQIASLIKGLAGKAMVIVDEAYVEFTDQPSWAAQLDANPNLLVMRTASKAYAMAGTRLGVLLATPELVTKLAAVLPPFPISAPTIQIATQALSKEGLAAAAANRKKIVEERKRFSAALARSPMIKKVYPSETNFVLVETENSDAFVEFCKKEGILVRNRNYDIPNTVRITIGTPEENARLLKVVGAA